MEIKKAVLNGIDVVVSDCKPKFRRQTVRFIYEIFPNIHDLQLYPKTVKNALVLMSACNITAA